MLIYKPARLIAGNDVRFDPFSGPFSQALDSSPNQGANPYLQVSILAIGFSERRLSFSPSFAQPK